LPFEQAADHRPNQRIVIGHDRQLACALLDACDECVEPLLQDAPDRGFSEPNRWGTGELEEAAIRKELVVEVRYDKVQGNRFRHGTTFLRFRTDREPASCRYDQLAETPAYELADIFGRS